MELEKDSTIKLKRLSADTNYYNNVFKKTEKIVSVTFYIVSETGVNETVQPHLENIKDKAFAAHETALKTLRLQPHEQRTGLTQLQYRIVSLESTLRIAQMAGVIPQDIFLLLADQLDAVLRVMQHHYLKDSGISVEELTQTAVTKSSSENKAKPKSTPQRRAQKVQIPAGDISTDAYLVYSQLTDRADRIKTVLEAKPQATIKDIAEVITDVSQKTIQRELNSLIEKGQVIREGERRWSTYSINK